MNHKKLLFIGFGDIAQRTAAAMASEGCQVSGIARRDRPVAPGVTFLRGAADDPALLQKLSDVAFDAAVITLTPGGRREEDYRRGYVQPSRALVNLWQNAANPPGLIVYVSSSSVYHQSNGEWVDEASPAQPQTPQAKSLLAAEQLWQDSTLNSCILRFSGIYGPGRDHLLRQVLDGKGGPRNNSPYTNRIHVDDCVGVIRHLCHRHWAGSELNSLYLASDNKPERSWQVRSWLAEQLGYAPGHLQESPASGRGGNKRCDNSRLRATGYQFKYPDYQSGYRQILQQNEGGT